jgi:lysophospholipase L1-like esterase
VKRRNYFVDRVCVTVARGAAIMGALSSVGMLLCAQPVQAPAAMINPQELNKLCGRVAVLMEAGGVTISELQRAAVPLVESTRGVCIQAQLRPNRSLPSYALLSNVRAYLALWDAVPKPFPFPEASQKQVGELRDDAARLEAHMRGLLEFNDRRLTPPDPANLARYAESNRRMGAPNPSNPRVVFFGDSITDFWRLNEYFPGKDYVNRGIAGQTTGEMLQRIQDDVIALKPQAVVILAGTNDLAREVPVAAIESNYRSFVTIANANKIKVIFASVLPVSDYHKDANVTYERTPARPLELIRALNDWLKSFCAGNQCTYLDYHSATADSSGQFQRDLSDDGLHPNDKGYRVMAPLVAAAISRSLSPAPAPVPAKPQKR